MTTKKEFPKRNRKNRGLAKEKDKNFKDISTFAPDNPYLFFIEECRNRREQERKENKILIPITALTLDIKKTLKPQVTPKTGTFEGEWHHIIPVSHGGLDDEQNLIALTFEEHIEAHRILAEMTGNRVDKATYTVMSSGDKQTWKERRIRGARASHEIQKRNQRNFFSQAFQNEMAQRSVASTKGKAARIKRGSEFGKSRQKDRILNFSNRFLLSRHGKEILCVTRLSTGGDFTRVLARVDAFLSKKIKEQKGGIRLTRIIKDDTKSLFGWRSYRLPDSEITEEMIPIDISFEYLTEFLLHKAQYQRYKIFD